MRSPRKLEAWVGDLLPKAGDCGQQAATLFLRAMLVGFTTSLTQLARQCDRNPHRIAQAEQPSTSQAPVPTKTHKSAKEPPAQEPSPADKERKAKEKSLAKTQRQFLARWLNRSHFEPDAIYAGLNRFVRRLLEGQQEVLLLIDFTDLERQWRVLQVSIPWQGRAIPIYRSVGRYKAPKVGQRQQVRAAIAWLKEHLPGPLARYVLVMDRGFPAHLLIRELTEAGWRFDLRVSGEWKMTHPAYTGQLKAASEQAELVGPIPRCFLGAVLGTKGKGRRYWSQANVVMYHGKERKEPWYLLTTETEGAKAVSIYRERMKIECEFKDLKGPLGLDRLSSWQDEERVGRFLALVAIYEWRLVWLWLKHRLHEWAPCFQVKGKLSWIRITREWIQHRLRRASRRALASL